MKKLIWIGASIVGLLVVITLVVRFAIPAETWKRLALEQFEAQTGMQATAESARLEFPWPVGLRLNGVTLDDARDEGAYSSLHATAEHVVVTAELMSLVRREPQVNEIRLVRPQVELELRDDEEGSTENRAETASSMAAVLSLVSVDDGELTIRSSGTEMVFRGLDQTARLTLADDGAFEGSMQGSLESLRFADAARPEPLELPRLEAALEFSGNVEAGTGRVQLQRFELARLRATGPIEWEQTADQTLVSADLDVEGDLADFESQLLAVVTLPPAWQGQVDIEAAKLTGKLTFAGAFPPPESDPANLLQGLAGEGSIEALTLRLFGLDPLQAEGGWRFQDSALHLDPLKVHMPAVDATGRLVMHTEPRFTGSLSGDTELAALTKVIRQVWPQLPADNREGVLPPEEWPALAGKAEVRVDFDVAITEEREALDYPVTLDIRLADVDVRPKGWNEALHFASGHAQGDLRGLELQDVVFSGPGLQGTGEGTVGGWPEVVQLTADVELERVDLDALQAATASLETSWWMRGVSVAHADEAPLTLPAPPEKLAFDVQAHAKSLRSRDYDLSDVTASGQLRNGRLDVQDAMGRLGSGTIQGTGSLDWSLDAPEWNVDARVDTVEAGQLLEPFAALLAGALSTNLSGNLDLRGPLVLQPGAMLEALTGEGLVKSTSGQLATEPVWGTRIKEFLGKEELFGNVDFQALTAGITVQDGRVYFERAVLNGDTPMEATGWVGLRGDCEYRLRVTLPPEASPSFGALAPVVDLLRDDQGQLTFGAIITGQAAKPTVKIDTDELQALAERAARDRVGEGLGGVLEGLLGGKKKGGGG